MATTSSLKRHQEVKERISNDLIRKIESAPDPVTAVDYLVEHTLDYICGIIDKMSPLGAAMVFGIIKIRSTDTSGEYHADFYRGIVTRCEELELNAVKGCVQARNETYRLTGILLP